MKGILNSLVWSDGHYTFGVDVVLADAVPLDFLLLKRLDGRILVCGGLSILKEWYGSFNPYTIRLES